MSKCWGNGNFLGLGEPDGGGWGNWLEVALTACCIKMLRKNPQASLSRWSWINITHPWSTQKTRSILPLQTAHSTTANHLPRGPTPGLKASKRNRRLDYGQAHSHPQYPDQGNSKSPPPPTKIKSEIHQSLTLTWTLMSNNDFLDTSIYLLSIFLFTLTAYICHGTTTDTG